MSKRHYASACPLQKYANILGSWVSTYLSTHRYFVPVVPHLGHMRAVKQRQAPPAQFEALRRHLDAKAPKNDHKPTDFWKPERSLIDSRRSLGAEHALSCFSRFWMSDLI